MYHRNFLLDRICDEFINLYKRSDNKKQIFNDKKVLRLYDLIAEEDDVKRMITFMSYYIANDFPTKRLYIKNIEIVEWNEGQSMDWHRDYPFYEGTSIIFLNDDYEGGEFHFFDGKVIEPEAGKLIIHPTFAGHGVKRVTKGNRYSCVAWGVGDTFV